jgi:hypothetical protein
MEVKVLGVDISKRIFQIHGIDADGKLVVKQRLSRDRFIGSMSNLPCWSVGALTTGLESLQNSGTL